MLCVIQQHVHSADQYHFFARTIHGQAVGNHWRMMRFVCSGDQELDCFLVLQLLQILREAHRVDSQIRRECLKEVVSERRKAGQSKGLERTSNIAIQRCYKLTGLGVLENKRTDFRLLLVL